MNKTVGEILLGRHGEVPKVQLETPSGTAAALMTNHQAGCVLVVDGVDVVGIVTKGDVLRGVVDRGPSFEHVPVADVMSSPVSAAAPETPVGAAFVMMTRAECSHLPVIKGATMLGVITAHDLMRAVAAELEVEISQLHQYIGGPSCTGSSRPSAVDDF